MYPCQRVCADILRYILYYFDTVLSTRDPLDCGCDAGSGARELRVSRIHGVISQNKNPKQTFTALMSDVHPCASLPESDHMPLWQPSQPGISPLGWLVWFESRLRFGRPPRGQDRDVGAGSRPEADRRYLCTPERETRGGDLLFEIDAGRLVIV